MLVGVSDPEPASLSLLDVVGHENATTHTYFSYAQPGIVDDDLAVLADLTAAGALVSHVGLRVSWKKASEALNELPAGLVDGKAMLTTN